MDTDELFLIDAPKEKILSDTIRQQIKASHSIYLISFPNDRGAFISKERTGQENGPSIIFYQEYSKMLSFHQRCHLSHCYFAKL